MSGAAVNASLILEQIEKARRVARREEARRTETPAPAPEAARVAPAESEEGRAPGSAPELAEQQGDVEGARGEVALKSARRAWPLGARTLFVVVGIAALGIMSFVLWKASGLRRESEGRQERGTADRIERHVPALELPRLPAHEGAPGTAPGGSQFGANGERALLGSALGATGSSDGSQDPPPATRPPESGPGPSEMIEQRRLARGFGAGESDGPGGAEQRPPPPAAPAPGRAAGELEEKLEPLQLKASSAGLLADRDYLLTQGAMIDCVLETKLVSTVAGMTSCHLTRDIYSSNGRVVLLDRGSKVVGHYQGGAQQGQGRIFVVWSRVETPAGVVVELQSPGTGPLGDQRQLLLPVNDNYSCRSWPS